MAGGGEIKSTLVLDVSKFSSALDKAVGGIDGLEVRLKSATKIASEFDKGVGKSADNMKGVADGFKMLDQTVGALVSKLVGATARFDELGKRADNASFGVDKLSKSAKGVTEVNAEEWTKRYAGALDQLAPALKSAVAGIVAFDRANAASAQSTSDLANKSVAAKIRMLNSERQSNQAILQDRRRTIEELSKIQADFDQKAAAAQARVEEARRRKKSGALARNDRDMALASSTEIASQIAQLEEVTKQIRFKNLGIGESIKSLEAEAAAAKAAGEAEVRAAQAATEAKKRQAEATRAAAEEDRRQARASADMMKNIGALWGASKIEHGLVGMIDQTSQRQTAELRLRAQNLPTAEFEEFKKKAFDLSRENAYMSQVDALNARLTALTSLGHNNVGAIDATLGKSVASVQAMQRLGYGEGSTDTAISNLYETAEARQLTNNPDAMNRNADLMFRITNASKGKITTNDLATILRSMGAGATTITDDGLYRMAALAEQSKVFGDGTGGASAGVSAVGTLIKMQQLYATGKAVSNTQLEQLIGSGVMSADAVDKSKFAGGRNEQMQIIRALKSSGYVNANQYMADPVGATFAMRDNILKYMQGSDANKKLYFGSADADVSNQDVQQAAFQKFFNRSGMSSKAIAANVQMMSMPFQERTENVMNRAKSGLGPEEVMKESDKTWTAAVDHMVAKTKELGQQFEPLTKFLTSIVSTMGDLVESVGKFAHDHQVVASITAMTVGFVAANVAIKSSIALFSGFRSVNSLLTALTANAGDAATKTGLLANVSALLGTHQQTTNAALKGGAESMSSIIVPTTTVGREAKTAAESVAQVGIKSRLAATGATVLNGAVGTLKIGMAALGGPIGAISLALSIGAVLWENWGAKAREALKKAKDTGGVEKSIEEHQKQLTHLKDAGGKPVDNELVELNDEIAEQEKMIAAARLKAKNAEHAKKVEANTGDIHGVGTYQSAGANKDLAAMEKRLGLLKQDRELIQQIRKEEKDAEVARAKVQESQFGKVDSQFALPVTKSDGRHHQYEDLFNKTFEDIVAQAKKTKLEIDEILTGASSNDAQAKAIVMGRLKAGELDKDKDPKNRNEFLKTGYHYDPKAEKYFDPSGRTTTAENAVDLNKKTNSGHTPQQMIDVEKEKLDNTDAKKNLEFSTDRYSAMITEANDASERFANGLKLETDAMRALNREFNRNKGVSAENDAEKALTAGMDPEKDAAAIAEKIAQYRQQEAMLARARIDSTKQAQAERDKTESINVSLPYDKAGNLVSDSDKLKAQQAAETLAITNQYQQAASSLKQQLQIMRDLHQEETDDYKKAYADQEAAAKTHADYMVALVKQQAEAQKTPIQKMTEDWSRNSSTEINKAAANWGNTFITDLNDYLTGKSKKLDMRKFLSNMLSDISGVMLKQQLAGVTNSLFGGVANTTNGLMGAVNQKPTANNQVMPLVGAAANSVASSGAGGDKQGGSGNALTGVLSGVKDFFGGIGDKFKALAGVTETAKKGMTDLVTDGITKTTSSMAEEAAQTTTQTAEQTTLVTAMSALTTAATSAATALTQVAASSTASSTSSAVGAALAKGGVATPTGLSYFANGGTFTNSLVDSPTVFKFANGGKFGVMGEAGPEAVVPLSRDGDGRLGVTMRGNTQSEGGNIITIEINVASDGTSKTTSSGDGASDWNAMASRVKAVVQQEILTQKRPGGMLSQ